GGLSILLLVGLLGARSGLPTDLRAVGVAFAIGLWPVLGPAALYRWLAGKGLGSALDGILTVGLLLAPFAAVLLGLVGEILIYVGAIWFTWTAVRRARGVPGRLGVVTLTFVLIGGALFILQIG